MKGLDMDTRIATIIAEAREIIQVVQIYGADLIGEPEDIGHAAVWLASDHSDDVKGVSLSVDGAMTLYPGFATGA
jgi:glucose 1-dehydrogenase